MEANNGDSSSSHSQQMEDEDRLSALTDDVLLSILGRVGTRMAARTSALSTRWSHLPWLLPELSIDAKDFLSASRLKHIKEKDMEEAMASLAKATRSFLVKPRRECVISSLHLKLYFIKTCQVGPIIGDMNHAMHSGLLKDLDFTILDDINPLGLSEEDMLQRTLEIDGIFSAYPNVPRYLTKISLTNMSFVKLDMHHVLFDCCKQLKHLSLTQCNTGEKPLFKFNAPNSKLCVLELVRCDFEKLEVACLPKLEKFSLDTMLYKYIPLAFGFVPFLGESELICGAGLYEGELKLSELLHGTTGIHTLTLDFEGENLWMQPEMKELCPAFNKLRKLFVRGIFVEFDILWMMAFLAAAPSIEMLHIEVWEHACDVDEVDGVYRRRWTH